jgi:sulfur carrier protein
VTVHLNGSPAEVAEGATVADVLALLDLPPQARGVAVAVDAEIVPRGEWGRRALPAGARVEIVTAIQGG